MARKFQNYKLKINYPNGDTEDVNFKGINTSNYKDMLNLYKEVKEQYKDVCCTIDFIGESENGDLGILFTKCIEIKEDQNSDMMRNTFDIASEIRYLLKLLNKKEKYHNHVLPALNKKQDVMLHQMENINKYKGTKNEILIKKVQLVDEVYSIRSSRRFHKNELKYIKMIKDKVEINSLLEKFNINRIKTSHDFVETEKDMDRRRVMKEVRYKSDKERLNLMKQLEYKYSKIVNDAVGRKLICYNNAS